MPLPKIARSDREIENCFTVLAQLRPHLQRDEFLQLVRHMQGEGYQLAYIEDRGRVVAVAGFRIFTSLFMGKNLYVDDLVTGESGRSKGHGTAMIAWLRDMAVDQQCRFLHLDSGTQRHRAHKFYLNQGFNIASYHFSQEL